ncbi:MAG TPA: DNA mismatch repair endonuclease MutL [Syntrophales bacterium]|nr:DNA mismatch repair endonuclease MutL [Syntrophales bacterium]HOX94995.1 DNA mismatch repair endonuclease MutL [Syntrophales bacterium]HPI57190.1 DNA mismatch repair endonuclease MutL [Syntrophales bacterium]HPN23426.1 DNA mismatch repair endonuclease MutL [Syntrophales bacterium]HQM28049.1 DNA mismatch repair endonuclease MutL [Syntrophales bacterium]
MNEKITILPDELTQKIAAGEVIERPASIVKELLENALDAGATEITVEIRKGGKEFIRVMDNGEGMGRRDASLAFERHATSKIASFDDLYRVRTFGFRGEALPSVAAVSRVELLTKQGESPAGTRVVVEAGKVKSVSDTGCPAGTSVSVSRIFDNVPVRKKFLKQDATEQGHCVDVISRIALAHPGVRFSVLAGGKRLLDVPGAADPRDRISFILGQDLRDSLIPVKKEKKNMTVSGFVSTPEQTRANARNMFFYVNKRYVRDPVVSHAVMSAYRGLIESKRYPAVMLFVDVAAEEVDVNVHPTKMEIRFRNPGEVHDIVTEAVAEPLAKLSPRAGTAESVRGSPGEVVEKFKAGVSEAMKRYRVSTGREKAIFRPLRKEENTLNREVETAGTELLQGGEPPDVRIPFSDLRYVGQAGGTYLFFEHEGGVVVIDQHAAHERILFEELKRRAAGETPVSQRLLMPEVVSFPPRDYSSVMACMDSLRETGFDAEPFGGHSVVVKAVPAILAHVHPGTLFRDLADEMSERGKAEGLEELKERVLTFMACRGAVKASQDLSLPEVEELLRKLDEVPFSSSCPHGRPVFTQLTFQELEKLFRRS